jgi:hypothetical protein
VISTVAAASLTWLAFDVVEGRFIAGRVSWDVAGDALTVSVQGGQRESTQVRGSDPVRLARMVLRELLAPLQR